MQSVSAALPTAISSAKARQVEHQEPQSRPGNRSINSLTCCSLHSFFKTLSKRTIGRGSMVMCGTLSDPRPTGVTVWTKIHSQVNHVLVP